MNVIIIDDEQEAVGCLTKLLQLFCPEVNLLGIANSAKEGVELIKKKKPDLVFLDVEMPQEKGFSVLTQLPERKFHTVFVTAYDKYAIRAIRMNALDYLLKPIDPDLLVSCIQKAEEKIKERLYPNYDYLLESLQSDSLERLGVPTNTGTKYIELQNILYLKSHDNYTEIVQEKCRPLLVSKSLKSFETILKNTLFSRVHQSFLVNINKIVEIQRMGGGFLVLTNNDKIPISRSKKEVIRNQLSKTWKLV